MLTIAHDAHMFIYPMLVRFQCTPTQTPTTTQPQTDRDTNTNTQTHKKLTETDTHQTIRLMKPVMNGQRELAYLINALINFN